MTPPLRTPGLCPVCGQPTPNEGKKFYCADHADPAKRPPVGDWVTPQDAPPVTLDEPPPDFDAPDGTEIAPASPYADDDSRPPPARQPAGGGWKIWKRKAKKAEAASGETKPRRKPPPHRKRISAAGDASKLYGYLGAKLEGTKHYPAGRMMAYQAQGAGVLIDRALVGSIADRVVVQPTLRTKDRWEPVYNLVGPPILMIGITNAMEKGNVGAANFLAEMLEYTLEESLVSLLPAVREARENKARLDAEIAETFGLEGSVTADGRYLSPTQTLIASMFAPPEGFTPGRGSEDDDGEAVHGSGEPASQGGVGV